MAQINETLRQHEKENFDYVDCGIRTLELAKNAYNLYSQMNTLEQRQILNVVLSNCTLKAGNVSYEYNPPFDLLTTLPKNEKMVDLAGQVSNSSCQKPRHRAADHGYTREGLVNF